MSKRADAAVNKNIVIDDHLEAYRTFFDHGWAEQIDRVAKGTALSDLVFDLALAWRGAANTHVMPWLMAHNLSAFYAGVMQSENPPGTDLVNGLLSRLRRDTTISIPTEVLTELRTLLRGISIQLGANRKRIVGEFDAQEAWKEFLGNWEFRFSLWGSQRLVYGAIYYAYEDFLLRCFRLATGRSDYRIQPKFPKDFADEFGVSLRDDCWSHQQVNFARLTRHALVHNGGRLTEHLKKLKSSIRVENGELQIMPPDTKALFNLLKVRALTLTQNLAERLRSGVVVRT